MPNLIEDGDGAPLPENIQAALREIVDWIDDLTDDDEPDEEPRCGVESSYGTCDRKPHTDDQHGVCVGGGSDPISDPEVWFLWGPGERVDGWQVAALVNSSVAGGLRADREAMLAEYAEQSAALREVPESWREDRCNSPHPDSPAGRGDAS